MAGGRLVDDPDFDFGLSRPQPPAQRALSVSEYLGLINEALCHLGVTAVAGEVSGAKVAGAGGHLYFDLKDDQSVLHCALFAGVLRRQSFRPANGMQVVVHGLADIYRPRGSFTFKVSGVDHAGRGRLLEQLRQLAERLEREGVFARLQRPLPPLVGRVGIITSPDGSVLHDMLNTLRERNPLIEVVFYPAAVQGAEAPASLIAALQLAYERRDCDVLIIGRGGGSFEELLAFSDEAVVRTVSLSPVPIISAVGHDPDTPLSDRAADLRASTPTRAAELVSAVTRADLLATVEASWQRLTAAVTRQLQLTRHALESAALRLEAAGPQLAISRRHMQLQQLHSRLDEQLSLQLQVLRARAAAAERALLQASPEARLQRAGQRLQALQLRLQAALEQQLSACRGRLAALDLRLERCGVTERLAALRARQAALQARVAALNPLAILARGFSHTVDAATGRTLDGRVRPGDRVIIRTAFGELEATVDAVRLHDAAASMSGA